MLLNGKTLEQSSWEEINQAGIKTVSKRLVLDLVQTNNYPHDKFEGMWLIDKNHLAVINDDDFGITSEDGNLVEKILPNSSTQDTGRVYIYPITLD
ncbi:esterase-like activity of phytase family protein [Spirabiliibacterium mucosae]|uniref:esterase-like activity of phytase family protein n=1 Tax=Spirabiliibacterium mucosae TaxID=28156 RepID=UPI001AADCE2F|nr:esterase-like activity of phytase family protein [Spirabiliibacterium mucosae]